MKKIFAALVLAALSCPAAAQQQAQNAAAIESDIASDNTSAAETEIATDTAGTVESEATANIAGAAESEVAGDLAAAVETEITSDVVAGSAAASAAAIGTLDTLATIGAGVATAAVLYSVGADSSSDPAGNSNSGTTPPPTGTTGTR